jgi:excinuclease ABC subunit C
MTDSQNPLSKVNWVLIIFGVKADMAIESVNTIINEQLTRLPEAPGVYLMRDSEGHILYIGKAINLRHRVRSYFVKTTLLSPKIQRMVSQVNHFDYFLTASEQEALVLEMSLIKQHRPHYNSRLKDDKSFPYLKIDPRQEWPCLEVTRRLGSDGARYFGPFASTHSLYKTLRVIRQTFPLRTCSRLITGKARPCFQFHIKHCLGPCTGSVSREEYASVIRDIVAFLEGKQDAVLTGLRLRMQAAAEGLDFEKAAVLRDQIQVIESVIREQILAIKNGGEQDVIAFACDKDIACFQMFYNRNGRVIGGDNFVLQGVQDEEPSVIMSSFVQQFYSSAAYIPRVLLLQYPLRDKKVTEKWLSGKRGSPVVTRTPARGTLKGLVDIVTENACQALERLKLRQLARSPATIAEALSELQQQLALPAIPLRIEGYDISNIQGTSATGSMVVFEKGRSKAAEYRRFLIKTVSGANDFAMLQEIIRRRFLRRQSPVTTGGWGACPDLVLIDGGKGQLSAVRQTLDELGLTNICVIGLAKENEEVFVSRQHLPVPFPMHSRALYLLQNVRDEAHRFALGYHHHVHKERSFVSALDGIRGIGPQRKKALLKNYGSIRKIREASLSDLAGVPGVSLSLARHLKENL